MIRLSKITLIVLCLMMLWAMSLINSFAQSTDVPSSVRTTTEEIFVKEGSGEVISVDVVAQTVVVKQDDIKGPFQNVTLTVDADTMITSQDSTLSISDLKAGNKVTIVYEGKDDGTCVAKSILVS